MMILGELRGQLRELIHNINNLSSKVDAVNEKVIASGSLPATVRDHEERIGALEADKNRRDGAMGFGGWLLRSPIVGWLATIAIALWAIMKGKTP